MNWRKWVHRLTGLDMHQHFTLTKGECRIEITTGPDGSHMAHAALFKFGDLVAETTDSDVVYGWVDF